MRESKVKRIVIRIGSIGLMLMLSLGMTACSCSRQEVGNTEETTINIITEKDSSGSNQGEDTAPKTQQIGNAKVEGNIVSDGGVNINNEKYRIVIEEHNGETQNNVWSEYYSPTLNETMLLKSNKISGLRIIYNTQGERIAVASEGIKDEPIEKTIETLVLSWDIADAIDKRYGGK